MNNIEVFYFIWVNNSSHNTIIENLKGGAGSSVCLASARPWVQTPVTPKHLKNKSKLKF
jgi:hypothetical protein